MIDKKELSTINKSFKILHNDLFSCEKISKKIISWLPKYPHEYIVICIGTDRSTGDSLGPLVGTILSKIRPNNLIVYGTLHEPIHAVNFEEQIQKIKKKHSNPFIIAVDACLGKSKSIGSLIVGKGSLKPGAALNKSLSPVGNIYFTGVVNVSGFMEFSVLQNTRLSIVVDMANKIASTLDLIDNFLERKVISTLTSL